MKLIEILVRELPNRGGWPVSIDKLVQNSIGCVYQAGGGIPLWRLEVAQDWELAEISRDQYYTALAASKEMLINKPHPVWNGEGLPPIGCECELYDCDDWFKVTVRYLGESLAVVYDHGNGVERAFSVVNKPHKFRPIRTEAERKRDAAISAMKQLNIGDYEDPAIIYDAIAAGKIPGVKLEAPDA